MRSTLAVAILLAITVPAAAKGQTLWAGEWEYRFDDRKISKARLEELLALREHGQTISNAVASDEVSTLWLHRSTTDFTKWTDWGPGWVAKVRSSLAAKTARLVELEAMAVPLELEPVKSVLAGEVRFFLEREALGAKLLADDNPSTQGLALVGGLDPVQACPKQVEKLAKTKDRAARLDVIASELGNCLNNARSVKDYPTLAWKKFLQRFRIRERQHTELNGP